MIEIKTVDTASSVIDYISVVQQLKKDNNDKRIFYRGHFSEQYHLIPSVFRSTGWDKENDYYHEIMVRCPERFIGAGHLDRLVTMQHYDVHTRLLDITESPLVALYFACKNYSEANEKIADNHRGAVIVFTTKQEDVLYADSDKALMLSCLPLLKPNEREELLAVAIQSKKNKKFKKGPSGTKYDNKVVEKFYNEICTEKSAFKREMIPTDIINPLFVQPNRNNDRILKQEGAFIINGLAKSVEDAELKLKEIAYGKIAICNQHAILKELEQLGINEATLFPEIDRVAKYIQR